MRNGSWALIPGLLLAVTACGPGIGSSTTPGPEANPVRVEVTNNYALPVEIFAVGSGITQRLGTVHPGMNGHFTVPPNMVGNGVVEFQARTDAQTYRSGPVMLAPGRIVDLGIGAQLFNSTATLRP